MNIENFPATKAVAENLKVMTYRELSDLGDALSRSVNSWIEEGEIFNEADFAEALLAWADSLPNQTDEVK